MAFCTQCGKQLDFGAHFCTGCGARVDSCDATGVWESRGTQSVQGRGIRYDGVVHKCPNCGQVLEAFEIECPACGYELRGSCAVGSLGELSSQLQRIGTEGAAAPRRRLFSMPHKEPTEQDERAASLIRAFPIPNTKEDLIEFIIVSAANVNADAWSMWKQSELSPFELVTSRAWLSKLEQAYQKARIVFDSDEDFSKVQELYESTQRKVTHAKRSLVRLMLFVVGVWVLLIIVCVLMPPEG